MKRLTLLLLFGLGASFVQAVETAGSTPFERSLHPLFVIRRSLNRNEVVYEARSTPAGFSVKDPISVYWVLKEKGGKIEPLNGIERRRAYGVSVERASDEEIIFSVVALPDRKIFVRRVAGGEVRATILIGGEEAHLKEIYVQTKPGGLIPKVEYTEIKGDSLGDGKPLVERVTK